MSTHTLSTISKIDGSQAMQAVQTDIKKLTKVLQDATDPKSTATVIEFYETLLALEKLKVEVETLRECGVVGVLNTLKSGTSLPEAFDESSKKTIMSMARSLKAKWKRELSSPMSTPAASATSAASAASAASATSATSTASATLHPQEKTVLPAREPTPASPPAGDKDDKDDKADADTTSFMFENGEHLKALRKTLITTIVEFVKSHNDGEAPIVDIGTIRYDRSGGLAMQVKVNACTKRQLFEKETEKWNMQRKGRVGRLISKKWYGKTFVDSNGHAVKIIKAKSANHKMPIIGLEKSTGQQFKYRPSSIRI